MARSKQQIQDLVLQATDPILIGTDHDSNGEFDILSSSRQHDLSKTCAGRTLGSRAGFMPTESQLCLRSLTSGIKSFY